MSAFFETFLVRSLSCIIPGCYVRDRLPEHEKTVLLTFEDGPDPASTPRLLALLEEYNISATFFLVGDKVAQYPELVREILERGHTLGNHTYHHLDAWKTSTLCYVKDVCSCSRIINSVAGELPLWWRPPYGHATGKLVNWCQRHGVQTVLWDVAAGDVSSRATVRSVERNIVQKIRPGSILSLHDNSRSARVTPAALREVLPRLIDDDWRFEELGSFAA